MTAVDRFFCGEGEDKAEWLNGNLYPDPFVIKIFTVKSRYGKEWVSIDEDNGWTAETAGWRSVGRAGGSAGAAGPVGRSLPPRSPFREPSELFYVADYANVLDRDTIDYMVERNDLLYEQTAPKSSCLFHGGFFGRRRIEDYAYAVFNDWGYRLGG